MILAASCFGLQYRSLAWGMFDLSELYNFAPIELRGDTMVGVAEFSKIHQYCYEGNGKVTGQLCL